MQFKMPKSSEVEVTAELRPWTKKGITFDIQFFLKKKMNFALERGKVRVGSCDLSRDGAN